VVEVYRDNDTSAFALRKPRVGYNTLMQDVAAGTIDAVIAWANDRLHRSPRELEDFIDLLEEHGTAVQTVQAGPIDLTTPAGRLVARQLGAVARYESEHRSARIRRKHREIAEAGRPNGGRRAYGVHPGGTELNNQEVEVIREATHRILAGESLRSVVTDFNTRGVPAACGGCWYPPTLRSVLLRPRVAGLRSYHGQIVAQGVWPAILDRGEWEALRHKLCDPGRRTVTSTARKHLLTGLARCGTCERVVISGATSTRGYPVYRCATRRHLVRRMRDIDTFVTDLVLTRLTQPDALSALTDTPDPGETRRLGDELQIVRARLDGEAERYAQDDAMTPTEYTTIVAALRTRMQDLEQRYVQLVVPPSRALDGLIGATDVRAVWEDLSLSRRRAVIATLVTVTLHPVGQGARTFDPASVQVAWT